MSHVSNEWVMSPMSRVSNEWVIFSNESVVWLVNESLYAWLNGIALQRERESVCVCVWERENTTIFGSLAYMAPEQVYDEWVTFYKGMRHVANTKNPCIPGSTAVRWRERERERERKHYIGQSCIHGPRARLQWMSYVSNEWGMSRTNESRRLWTGRVFYDADYFYY